MTSKQHYLIPMTRGLGSIRTIHGAFLHSATDREKLHTVLRRRSQFFFYPQGNFRNEAKDSHRSADDVAL